MNIDNAEHEMIRMRDPSASVMHRKQPVADSSVYAKLWEQSQKIEQLELELDTVTKDKDQLHRDWQVKYNQAHELWNIDASKKDDQIEKLTGALRRVQSSVCGEAAGRWNNDPVTFASRDFIADTCDKALFEVKGETK